MSEAQAEMPRYQCHKKVWALKIADIKHDGVGEGEARVSDGTAIITPAESGYAPFKVDAQYVAKHNPQVGGYYVVYEDGYKSFSPAEAFEKGYAPISWTPAAHWRQEGKADPHGSRYDCERARLAHGDMTDDELANAVYLNPEIGLLTAAKERIRWLSRQLEKVSHGN